MSAPAALPASLRRDDGADRLAGTLDLAALVAIGWDPLRQVLSPDPSHPLLGYDICAVEGCGSEASCRGRLCGACFTRRARHPAQRLEEFLAAGVSGPRPGERLCLVCRLPGFSRPAVSSNELCLSCDHLRITRCQSITAYVDGDESFPPAAPRPSPGSCCVIGCDRLAARAIRRLCDAHDQAWRRTGRPELEAFCRTAPLCRGDRQGRVVLQGLRTRVVSELLAGVEGSLHSGRHLPPSVLRACVDHLRRQQVDSTAQAELSKLPPRLRHFLVLCLNEAQLRTSSAEGEQENDVWDLRQWGKKGRLSFVGAAGLRANGRPPAPPISQPWLRAGAKSWAADALGQTGKVTVQTTINAVGVLSEHLARREDAGRSPGALSRRDVEGFLARLGRLEASGAMSPYVRRRTVDLVGKFVRDCRALGLSGPGGPMAGRPDEVALRRRDRPPPLRRERDDAGRALPEVVLAQLLSEESLERLEQMSGSSARAAVELGAGVGRRTGELCALSFFCLDYDSHLGEDGEQRSSPVLVHDMPKVGLVGVRLPVHEREVAIITAQQERVRAAFPGTPPERLVLFPKVLTNPDGTRPVSASWLAWVMRRWVDALPRLDGPETDACGRPLPFPRERVIPYAFRHSFAQRHADAGTPIDTLKELLGHGSVRVTSVYYRVTARRKRAAQDALGSLQLDAAARRVRPGVGVLGAAEALREQIGQVAVPFGVCTEPTNVSADGRSCPFRHRCLGCEYFRTDPSYQPEFDSYLNQLLADKERLVAAVPALADWARADAMPSDEEIEALRRLLRANSEVLAGLDPAGRQQIEAAIVTLRTERAGLARSFPVHLRGVARQGRPSLFPTIERAHLDNERASG